MDCLKINANGTLQCLCCKKEFTTLSALMLHIKAEHGESEVLEAVKKTNDTPHTSGNSSQDCTNTLNAQFA
jgi:hypothetical protein